MKISDKYVQLKKLGIISGNGVPKTVPVQKKKTSWRDWQADAINKIGDADFFRVNAPTGSGKSRLLSFLGTKQITKGKRVLVLVPQNNIVSAWPAIYDFEKDWKPTNLSNSTLSTKQELVQLINGGHDVAICCYPSFVNLINSLKKSRKLAALKDLFLIIDEAHHLSQQEDAFNGLGKALDLALPHLGGCGLSTATPFRGDRLQYLSKENIDKYFGIFYHLSMAEFFSSKDCGVERLHYNFYLFGGSYVDALKKAKKEGKHFIIYLPRDGSYLRLGSKEKDYKEVSKVFHRNLNLLDYNGNNQKQNVNKLIKNQYINVEALITQNLIQEGSNWPLCDSIISIGYSTSITQTIQRIGRMLRNYDCKTDVSYCHLLPYTFNNKDEEKARETFNEYLKVITASMIVSEILQTIYLPRTKRDVQRKPSEKNRKIFNALEVLLGDVGEVANFKEAVLKNTLSNTDSSSTKKERQDVLKSYIKQELQNRNLEVSDEVQKDIFLEIYIGLARIANLLPLGLSLKEVDMWLLSDSEDPFTVFSTADAKTFDRVSELLGEQRYWTNDIINKNILQYYKDNGYRPSERTPPFSSIAQYLYRRNTSLRERCDVLGLNPIYIVYDDDFINKSIVEYQNNNGKLPKCRSSKIFKGISAYLRRNGSSLKKRCKELGFQIKEDYTLSIIDKLLSDLFNRTNKRPTVKSTPNGNSINKWLSRNGSSLSKRCDDLGFPAFVKDTCFDSVDIDIKKYNKNTGKRPGAHTSKHFAYINSWLVRKGTSLSKRCDQLGLPKRSNWNNRIK